MLSIYGCTGRSDDRNRPWRLSIYLCFFNLVKIIGNENYKSVSKTRIIFAIILCIILILLLIIASLDLPLYGHPNTEVQSHLTKYYIENKKK